MKLGMVFPGQGSQSVGMLRAYAGLPGVDAARAEAAGVLGEDFLKLLDELTTRLNDKQSSELAKGLINLGNLIIGSFLINQAIAGELSFGIFIFSAFWFFLSWGCAIVLLADKERMA